MTIPWQIIPPQPKPPQEIMDEDYRLLLKATPTDLPLLHLYRWERPAYTYGYFLDPKEYLNMSSMAHYQLIGARRPTGGGLLFHLNDLAFSLIIPKSYLPTFETPSYYYAYIHDWVKKTLHPFLPDIEITATDQSATGKARRLCMASSTTFDLILHDKKWGGAAQRHTQTALLHQMSLSLAPLPLTFLEECLLDAEWAKKIYSNSTYLFPKNDNLTDLESKRSQIEHLLIQALSTLVDSIASTGK